MVSSITLDRGYLSMFVLSYDIFKQCVCSVFPVPHNVCCWIDCINYLNLFSGDAANRTVKESTSYVLSHVTDQPTGDVLCTPASNVGSISAVEESTSCELPHLTDKPPKDGLYTASDISSSERLNIRGRFVYCF